MLLRGLIANKALVLLVLRNDFYNGRNDDDDSLGVLLEVLLVAYRRMKSEKYQICYRALIHIGVLCTKTKNENSDS